MVKSKKKEGRLPPVKIPLDFDTAVGGLLAVDPKKIAAPKKRAAPKEKPAKKK